MSQAPEETAKPKSGLLKGALWGVALLGVAAVVYIMAQASINPRQTTSLKSLAKGEMAKLVFPAEAGPADPRATRTAMHRTMFRVFVIVGL